MSLRAIAPGFLESALAAEAIAFFKAGVASKLTVFTCDLARMKLLVCDGFCHKETGGASKIRNYFQAAAEITSFTCAPRDLSRSNSIATW